MFMMASISCRQVLQIVGGDGNSEQQQQDELSAVVDKSVDEPESKRMKIDEAEVDGKKDEHLFIKPTPPVAKTTAR
jgi:hypothetical protein